MKRNIFDCESEDEFMKNKYDLHELDMYGMNALFHSDLEKSKWLINHGINIYHLDHENNNVIMFISSGDIDKAQYLLDIGYDITDFVKNPEKLTLGKMRSAPVSRLIQAHFPKYFENITLEERNKINATLKSDKKVLEFPPKKRRL